MSHPTTSVEIIIKVSLITWRLATQISTHQSSVLIWLIIFEPTVTSHHLSQVQLFTFNANCESRQCENVSNLCVKTFNINNKYSKMIHWLELVKQQCDVQVMHGGRQEGQLRSDSDCVATGTGLTGPSACLFQLISAVMWPGMLV